MPNLDTPEHGRKAGPSAELDPHFESTRKAAQAGGDASLDVILRWLHVASRRMVAEVASRQKTPDCCSVAP
jgi:hypothetical protein